MSVRLKQLALLLGIALLSVVLSGWQSLRQFDPVLIRAFIELMREEQSTS